MMNTIMEWSGVVLIALALSFIHPAFAIGTLGVYLLVGAVMAEWFGGSDDQANK